MDLLLEISFFVGQFVFLKRLLCEVGVHSEDGYSCYQSFIVPALSRAAFSWVVDILVNYSVEVGGKCLALLIIQLSIVRVCFILKLLLLIWNPSDLNVWATLHVMFLIGLFMMHDVPC